MSTFKSPFYNLYSFWSDNLAFLLFAAKRSRYVDEAEALIAAGM